MANLVRTIIVFDSESTGLPHESRSSVIELAAIALQGSVEVGTFSCFVQPTNPLGDWSKQALDINQIKPEWIEGAPTTEKVWDSLLHWLVLFAPLDHCTSYNVSFDKEMFRRSFPKSELLPWGPCLMERSMTALGLKRWPSLKKAAAQFDIEFEEEKLHRALGDARLASQVMAKL